MSAADETTRITATVTLDIHPRTGQSLEEAAAEFQHTFRQYLEDRESPFRNDYGAKLHDIRAALTDDDAPGLCWGGYEGPYVTNVSITDGDKDH